MQTFWFSSSAPCSGQEQRAPEAQAHDGPEEDVFIASFLDIWRHQNISADAQEARVVALHEQREDAEESVDDGGPCTLPVWNPKRVSGTERQCHDHTSFKSDYYSNGCNEILGALKLFLGGLGSQILLGLLCSDVPINARQISNIERVPVVPYHHEADQAEEEDAGTKANCREYAAKPTLAELLEAKFFNLFTQVPHLGRWPLYGGDVNIW